MSPTVIGLSLGDLVMVRQIKVMLTPILLMGYFAHVKEQFLSFSDLAGLLVQLLPDTL